VTEVRDPREQQTAVGDQSVPKVHFALAIPAANLKRSARMHHHHDQPHVMRETGEFLYCSSLRTGNGHTAVYY
jgi:hypothetical protein